MIDTITITTPVKHRDGKSQKITRALLNGDVTSEVDIAGEDGHSFTGSPALARAAGFAFGDEDFASCAVNYADLPEMYLLSVAEYAFTDPGSVDATIVTQLAQFGASAYAEIHSLWARARDSDREIASLQADHLTLSSERDALVLKNTEVTSERDTLRTALAGARAQTNASSHVLSTFKEQVREAVIDWAKENNQCKDGTNDFLTNLGLDKWESTFTVEGRINGRAVLTANEVEADDAYEAIAAVRDNLSFDVDVTGRIQATVSWDDGDADESEYRTTFDETEDYWDEDVFTEWMREQIEWSADEN